MSDDLEKLRRIRDRQLADRNPLEKQKQFQGTYARKASRVRGKRYSLGEAWNTIPHVVRSPLIAFLVGIGVMILLPRLWDSRWAFLASVGVMVFLILIAVVIGQALDVRDDLKDFSKH